MNSESGLLRALAKFLSAENVRYAVIGGLAVSAHGEPRFTADVDVNIILEKGGLGLFMRKAAGYGFRPASAAALRIADKTGVVLMKHARAADRVRIEFIIAENPPEYAAIKRARPKKMGFVKLRVITAEDLLIHKLASVRAKDSDDVMGILRRQGKRLDLKYIRSWLKRIDKANKGCRLNARFDRLLLNT